LPAASPERSSPTPRQGVGLAQGRRRRAQGRVDALRRPRRPAYGYEPSLPAAHLLHFSLNDIEFMQDATGAPPLGHQHIRERVDIGAAPHRDQIFAEARRG
jgi:hypothetical protein